MASYPMNKKRKNFSKLSRAIIDLCTETLRVTLDSHTKPQAIANKLSTIPNQPKLNAREMSRIKDASKVGSYKDFDISLLYQILRCVCNQDIRDYLSKQIHPSQLQNNSAFMADLTQDELKKVQQISNTGLYGGCNDDLLHKLHIHFCQSQPQPIHPSKGWGKTPDANDTDHGDNIERVREIRNSLYGHIPSTEVSDTDFESHWNQLIVIMSGMNTHLQSTRGSKDFKDVLDGIKSSSMDEDMEQFYIDEIKRLAKYEEDLAKQMDEVETALTVLVEKGKEDNKKIEALSEKTERLAIDTNTKQDQIKSQLANVGGEVIQIYDRLHMTESKRMMLQVGQEKLEDEVDGLRNQISNLDTKVQKTADTTEVLEGALETVKEDVATLKEHTEGRRESSGRRKMTATEQVTSERISRIVNSGIFHTTRAIKKGKDILKENGSVIFTGQPGQGKTDGAFYLLHLFQQEHPDWIFVHYTNLDIQQWRESLDENTKTVMLLDDILGRTNTDENVKSRGEYYWRDIFSMIKSGKLKVILTFRKFILERNMSELEKYDLFSTKNIIDLSTPEYQLTNEEKEQILNNHLKANNIQIGNSPFYSNFEQAEKLDKDIKLHQYDIEKIFQTNPVLGFPLSCFLFCSYKKYTKQGAKFFTRPNECLKQEINSMVSIDSKPIEKIQYCLMSYMMLNGGELDSTTLDMKILDEVVQSLSLKKPSKRDIEEAIIGIKDRYIVKMNKKYVFKHQTILECVTVCFCKDNVASVLKVCDKRFISEFIRPQNFDVPKGEVVVLLEKDDYMHLIRRIKHFLQYEEIQGDKKNFQWRGDWYGWWSTHPLMDDKEFVDLFIKEIQSYEKMKSGIEKCLNHKPKGLFHFLCVSGKTHLIDSLYNMFHAQISGLNTSLCLVAASLNGRTSTVMWLMDNNIGISNIIKAFKCSAKSEISTAIIGHRKFTNDHIEEVLKNIPVWFPHKVDNTTINLIFNRWPDIEQKCLFQLLIHKTFENPIVVDTLFSCRPDSIIPSFLWSCLSGRYGIAKLILSKHSDEIKEQHIQNGVLSACFRGYFSVVDVLLKSTKAHLIMQQTLKMGFSFACAGGNKDFFKFLCQNSICDDIYQEENNENLTNVHIASFFGRAYVFRTLVGWGLNVTDVSQSGRSALGYAMLGYRFTGMNGNEVASAIQNESNLLWELCINPGWSVKKKFGTPSRQYKFGTVSEFTEILEVLIRHKDVGLTDLSMTLDEKDCTLGHYCVAYDNLSIIKLICEVNPSALSCQNTNGHKTIHLAALMGRYRIFKKLLSICSKPDGIKVPYSDTVDNANAFHQLIAMGKEYAGRTFRSKDYSMKPEFLNFLPVGHSSITFDRADFYEFIEKELPLKSGV